MVAPMLQLKRLCLVSQVPKAYFIALICASINVNFITTGDLAMAEIDDTSFSSILSRNRLNNLQELKVSKSSHLTYLTAYNLIENCPNLRRLGMLEFWENVTELDLERLRKMIRDENYDVDTGGGHNTSANALSTYWSRQSQSLQSS